MNSTAELFQQEYPKMRNMARKRCEDMETAEELVSETFEKVCLAMRKGKTIHHLRGYTYRTLTNLITDHHRSKKRRPRTFHEETTEELDEQQSCIYRDGKPNEQYEPDPEEQLLAQEADEELRQTMRNLLPETQQQVLIEQYWKDSPWPEIAQTMGNTKGAVMAYRVRALKTMKNYFEKVQ